MYITNYLIEWFCTQASLDEPTQAVVMHRTEPTRHQSLALQLAEKVATLVDNNDRIMEMKQGGYFFQKQGKHGCPKQSVTYHILSMKAPEIR